MEQSSEDKVIVFLHTKVVSLACNGTELKQYNHSPTSVELGFPLRLLLHGHRCSISYVRPGLHVDSYTGINGLRLGYYILIWGQE